MGFLPIFGKKTGIFSAKVGGFLLVAIFAGYLMLPLTRKNL